MKKDLTDRQKVHNLFTRFMQITLVVHVCLIPLFGLGLAAVSCAVSMWAIDRLGELVT